MQIKVIENIESLKAIQGNWEDLYNEGNYSVFQSFDYCYHSAVINKSKLFVITLEAKGNLLELWPCEIINKKLRFINDLHADFCAILSKTDSQAIVQYIKESNQIKGLQFKNLKRESFILSKIKKLPNVVINQKIDFSILKLKQSDNFPANFEKFVYRQKRRLKRILNKYSAEHTIYSSNKNSFPLDAIKSLRDEMINNGSRPTSFLDDSFLFLCKQLYQNDTLIVSAVEIEDNFSAISLLFKNNNDYSFWVDLYNNQQMMNLFHNTLFIKRITSDESAIFNFGRGAYLYKLQNFAPEIHRLYECNTFKNSLEKMKFITQEKVITWIKLIYKKINK